MAIPFKSDTIIVPSGGAADPRVITGTSDPTGGVSAPEGSIYLRYVASNGQAFVKGGPADVDWVNLVTAGGSTLDGSYDFGGAGAGRTIIVDSGAIQLDAFIGNAQAALQINRQPSIAAASVGIDLAMNANVNASGVGIQVSDAGAGTSLKVTKSNSGSAYFADLTNAGAKALEIVVTAAPTSVSPISVVANTTGTTAELLSISKIPAGSTAGNALSVSMGANTTGSGVTVSQAGTGAAIEIAAGSLEVANSAAGVSPANRGRLRYNSGTQTFQVSLNGAAYVDVATGAGFTLDIGDSIGSSTVGSVLFVGAGNVLQQDNANFFWDDTNNSLVVTTTTTSPAIRAVNADAATGAMAIRNTNASGPVDFYAIDSVGNAKISWGYGNASYSDVARASRGYVWRNTGVDFVFARVGVVDAILKSDGKFGIGPNATPFNLLDVNSTGASQIHISAGSVDSGGYLTSTVASQLYLSGGLGFDGTNLRAKATSASVIEMINGAISLQTATGLTIGAISAMTERVNISTTGVVTISGVAVTNSLVLTTGNALLSNGQLQVTRNNATDGCIFVQNNNGFNSGPSAIGFLNQAASFRSYVGYFPSAYAFTYLQLKNGFLCQTGEDFVVGDSTNSTIVVQNTNRRLGVGAGLATPLYTIDARGSTAASRIHFGFSTTDDGGYLISAQASQAVMAGGMSYDGTQYIAKATTVGAFDIVGGEYLWYSNIGQTIGAAATAPVRMKLHAAGGLEIGNSDAATVSAVGFGKIRYTTSGQKFQVSMNGAAYVDLTTGGGTGMVIGNAITSATQGSVLFAGVGGILQQDNANFFWDDTNDRLGIGTAAPGVPLDVSSATTVAAVALRAGSTAAVSAASTGRVRYDESVQRFQGSTNAGAYADFKFTTTEYLSVDGAADPAIETSFVSGTGTDLTLANGTRGGFIKNFVITGGTGTITPTNLADGNVLTWSATPANVSFIWDATNTTWHVIGNPYNMVTT